MLTNAYLPNSKGSLGYIHCRQANNEQARICFEHSVLHARNDGAEALGHLCVTLRELGDFAGAEQSGQRAVDVAHMHS